MTNIIADTLEAIRRGLLDLKTGRVIDDDALAAMTLYLEAWLEKKEGMIPVGEVIRNRMKEAKKLGKLNRDEVFEVVFAPYQFSCWNTDAPSRAKALSFRRDDPVYLACIEAWRVSETTNFAKGANHYLNPKTVLAAYGKLPSWANDKTLVVQIGAHNFYKV